MTLDEGIDGALASIPVLFGIAVVPVMWDQLSPLERLTAVALYALYLIGMTALLRSRRDAGLKPAAVSDPS